MTKEEIVKMAAIMKEIGRLIVEENS